MKQLLCVFLFLAAAEASLAETKPPEAGELKPSSSRYATVTLQKGIYPEQLAPLQYMSEVLSCTMKPPAPDAGDYCPTFAVKFIVKDDPNVPADLLGVLGSPREPERDRAMKFWMDSDGTLRVEERNVVFTKNLSYLFVPHTRVRKQWVTETKKEDVLVVLTEACDGDRTCRAGLWIFTASKNVGRRNSRIRFFTPALVPLLNPVDWEKLEFGPDYGLYSAGDQFALLLPFKANAPTVAWFIRFGGLANVLAEAWPIQRSTPAP